MSPTIFSGASDHEKRLLFFAGELVQEGSKPEEKRQEMKNEEKEEKAEKQDDPEKPDEKALERQMKDRQNKAREDADALRHKQAQDQIAYEKVLNEERGKDAARNRLADSATQVASLGVAGPTRTQLAPEAGPPPQEAKAVAQQTGTPEAAQGTANVEATDKAQNETQVAQEQQVQRAEGQEGRRQVA